MQQKERGLEPLCRRLVLVCPPITNPVRGEEKQGLAEARDDRSEQTMEAPSEALNGFAERRYVAGQEIATTQRALRFKAQQSLTRTPNVVLFRWGYFSSLLFFFFFA